MISRNIWANLIGRLWGFISVYLFVPVYLKYLGVEAYGLVGFYSTLLGVLAFADMGFSATLSREMARLSVLDDVESMRDLLRTYELSYVAISTALAVGMWACAPLIAERWLHSATLSSHTIASAISLMGVAIAFQLPSGLYMGGLMGLQCQVKANSLQIAWSIYRGGGAIAALALLGPTIINFAASQLIANIIFCISVRQSLWKCMRLTDSDILGRFRFSVFRSTWRYASGITGMAVLSVVLTQIDKLAVSKLLSLQMLGYYSLAGSLAAVPLLAAGPIASAIFPRFNELVVRQDWPALKSVYHRTCELVALAVIPCGVVLVVFSKEAIFAWTGSSVTAASSNAATSLLLMGQLLQAMTVVPYYLALAHGKIKLNMQISAASAILIVPILIVLIRRSGIEGAALSWFVVNAVTFFPYMYLLHRELLPGELVRWMRSSVLPVLVTVPCVFLFKALMPELPSRWMILAYFSVPWIISVIAVAAITPSIRLFVVSKINNHSEYNCATKL